MLGSVSLQWFQSGVQAGTSGVGGWGLEGLKRG